MVKNVPVGRSRKQERDRRVSNRERILEAGLQLFNQKGTHAVSTNHIAAHLSISPGNLYYHYRNREEIVRAIFPEAAAAVAKALPVSADLTVTAADVASYHLAGIETLWRFRFLFRDLDELLSRDPQLAESYRKVQSRAIRQFRVLFERLIAQRDMRRPDPHEDLARIATNAFVLWTNWIRYLTSSRGTVKIRYADLAEGALHGFLGFAPYLEPSFAAEIRATFSGRPAAARLRR